MRKLIIEGVRCFPTRQEVPVAPITVLTGENSTGKSTFLALHRLAWDLAKGAAEPNFNEAPFSLGSYDEIASTLGSRGGQAKNFRLGLEIPLNIDKNGSQNERISVEGEFFPINGHPSLNAISIKSGSMLLERQFSYEPKKVVIRVTINKKTQEFEEVLPDFPGLLATSIPYIGMIVPMIIGLAKSMESVFLGAKGVRGLNMEDLKRIADPINRMIQVLGERPVAHAPVHSRPHRTFDPFPVSFNAEGEHVPSMLALNAKNGEFMEDIGMFGQISGLYDAIHVKRRGGKEVDPFQISVKIAGSPTNLVDVGYGVSQALPIVADTLAFPNGTSFLLQQPEVHLHPRAQAALASFFVRLFKEEQKQFIIETHSDYLVDRLRIEVQEGNLDPKDVLILYFGREDSGVKIYPITVDSLGNLLNVPPGYRDFFLEEDSRFLGV